MDGHHGHQVAELVAKRLPDVVVAAIATCGNDVQAALALSVRALDDAAFAAHAAGALQTGGTTVILLALAGLQVFAANVGDCKAIMSSRGAPEALSEAHNPPVENERQRFEAAGVVCFSDHIGGSDINVCRTIGDYDLGPPLKWRVPTVSGGGSTLPCGPLISEPEITIRQTEPIDEFIVVATDGLYDYYTPESSIVTEARRRLRVVENDAQACAEWLVDEALSRQRGTLHEGTPGDNVTVMVIRLRPLPQIPRTSASRLNLRRAPSDSEVSQSVISQLKAPLT
jgi:serine/threonine protein phosphatase PrpC